MLVLPLFLIWSAFHHSIRFENVVVNFKHRQLMYVGALSHFYFSESPGAMDRVVTCNLQSFFSSHADNGRKKNNTRSEPGTFLCFHEESCNEKRLTTPPSGHYSLTKEIGKRKKFSPYHKIPLFHF